MKLRKEEFAGTGQVYRFTLIQLIKNRANIISLVITMLFLLLSVPVFTYLNTHTKDTLSSLENIYYQNETDWELDFQSWKDAYPVYKESELAPASFRTEEWKKTLAANEAFVHISEDQETGNYNIRVYALPEMDEKESDTLLEDITAWFQKERYAHMGITEEQMAQLVGFDVQVDSVGNYQEMAEENMEAENAAGADTSFFVQYIYAILVLILCTFSTTFIVRAVIEEKASKLVETLLISVRPLALILGKIMAVMTYVFGMILMMIAGVGISYGITGIFMDTSVITDMMAEMGLTSDMLHLGPSTVMIVLISLVLAYFTFSIIGGIAGTSCSSMEDVESANANVLIFLMGGYMVSCFTTAFGGNIGLATSFIPFVSAFCAPVQYVLGNISMPMLCLAWLVQLILVAFLAWFCAVIYADLIMHRGSKLKFRNLVALAREKKGGTGR